MKGVVGEVKIQEQLERNFTHFSEKYKTCLVDVISETPRSILKITSQANPRIIGNIDLAKLDRIQETRDGLVLRFRTGMNVIIRKCKGVRQLKELIDQGRALERGYPVSNMGSLSSKKHISPSEKKMGPLSQIMGSESNIDYIQIGKDLTKIPIRKRQSESPDEKSGRSFSTSTPKGGGVTHSQREIPSDEDDENKPLFTHVKKRRISTEGGPHREDHMDVSWQNDSFEIKQSSSSEKKTTPRSFLEKAEEKSQLCENNSSLSSKSFYKSSSDAGNRMHGSFGLSSGKTYSKKRPERKLFESINKPVNYSKSSAVVSSQSGLRGFSNLGNTCYMNAILQSLFALESFADDLTFLQNQTRRLAHCQKSLFFLLANLLEAQKKKLANERQDKCLSEVKQAISASAKRFCGKEQHDAHEFLSQVIDQVKEETQKENRDTSGNVTTEEKDRGETMKHDVTKDTFINPAVLNFEFEVLHTITCLKCGSEVRKVEIFHDLPIDMPKRMNCDDKCTLQDALDQFFQREKIDYTCEKCDHKQVEVLHTFNRAPRIVVLQLKRYRFNTLTTQNRKLARSIGIPRYLTLSDHCTQETSPPYFIDMRAYYKIRRDPLMCTENKGPSPDKMEFSTQSETNKQSETRPKFTFKKAPPDIFDLDLEDDFQSLSTPQSKLKKNPLNVKQQEEDDLARALEESRCEKENTDMRMFTNGMSEEAQLKIAMERSLNDNKQRNHFRTPDSHYDWKNSDTRSRSPKTCSKKLKLDDAGDDCVSWVSEKETSHSAEKKTGCDQNSKTVKKHTMYTEYLTLSSDSESERGCEMAEKAESGTKTGETVSEKSAEMKTVAGSEEITIEGVRGLSTEPEWLIARKKEEQDLDKAMELSLKDSKHLSSATLQEKEEGDLRRAIELSLKDVGEEKEQVWPLDESFLEEPVHRSVHSAEEIHKNLKVGNLPYSYRLVSIVSHFGSSSVGHYISDVYNADKDQWFSYSDKDVSQMCEESVQENREHTGYIFFYVNREILSELENVKRNKKSALKENISQSEKKLKQQQQHFPLFSARKSAPTSLSFMKANGVL